MKVSIVVIGDELLLGNVTDTNSPMIARAIAPAGWEVTGTETVGDNLDDIAQAVERALERADVVLTTGGIGPTRDDMTRKALMRVFGGELKLDVETLENVKRVVAARGFALNDLTASQAMVPTSCRVVQNRFGTAPLMWFEKDGKVLVTLPGVPFETAAAFPRDVFPALRRHFGDEETIHHQTLMITGLRESQLAEMLAPIEDSLPGTTHLAYLPEPSVVRLRIDYRCGGEMVVNRVKQLIGPRVISDQDLPLAGVLIKEARDRGMKLGTAESCTGGRIASLITQVAGCSDVMQGGVVSYSNDVKSHVLGVDSELINANGAVSIPVAEAMARGAQAVLGAGIAVATSGIAGPGGGSEDKPVGTVCIAAAVGERLVSETAHFPGNRERVISQASARGLVMAIELLCGC